MKLILGTAQLGTNYGISNNSGIPSNLEIDEIFKICHKNNLLYCDTAIAYGKSQKTVKSRGMKIITKVSVGKHIEHELERVFNEFENSELDTLLVHNSEKLISNIHYWDLLRKYKEEKDFRLGISIYTPNQFKKAISQDIIPDVVQLPYNIFDRKFEKILLSMKKLGVEIHARSVFLQGLFFIRINQIPKKIESLTQPLIEYDKFCGKNLNKKIENALHFVLHNKMIDKLIVGVEKSNQLLELINCYNSYNGEIFSFNYRFNDVQKHFLNPINW